MDTQTQTIKRHTGENDIVPWTKASDRLEAMNQVLELIQEISKENRRYHRNDMRVINSFVEKFLFNYNTPKYKHIFTSSGNEWYRISSLYAKSGNIHTDRRLTILPRTTQSFGVTLTYVSEAVTALASAFSYYLMYKTGKNAYHTIKEHTFGLQPEKILDSIKKYIIELIAVIRIIYTWYIGQIDTQQALLMFAGLGGWIAAKHYLLSALLPQMKPVPANLITRETQAFDPPTLTQNILSILILLGLGSNSTLDAKTLMNSIKGLSATILTVKTVENVFVNIITYLPDIIQSFICEKIPAFGMYILMTTQPLYRKLVELSHDLMNRTETDVFYNSHNFARFLDGRWLCKKICTENYGIKRKIYRTIPEIITWYDKMYQKADELGLLPGRRKLPFVIWLSGDPGIGKSTMVKEIAEIGLEQMLSGCSDDSLYPLIKSQDISKYIYSHNTSNKYFDGYNNQPIFVLNDYLQFTQEKEEQWLIRFVDTNECPLEVSSVDNISTGVKGEVRFTSRIIIVTSNVTHLHNSPIVTNLDAFNRRRDIVVSMKWKEDHSVVDFDNFDYSWCDFIRKRPLPFDNGVYEQYRDVDHFCQNLRREISNYLVTSGKMELRHAEETSLESLKNIIRTSEDLERTWDGKLWDVWNKVMSYADTEIFGIPLKYLLPLIVGGASATYAIYKSWVPSLVSTFTSHSLSGDVATQRLQRKTKPITRMAMGSRQNDVELAQRISKNMVRLTTIIEDKNGKNITQTLWGWSPGGSLIITPKHLWKRGDNVVRSGDVVRIERGPVTFDFIVDKKNVYLSEEEDLAIINISGDIPLFKTQRNIILASDALIDEAGEEAMLILLTKTNAEDYTPTILPVKSYLTDAPYVDDYGTVYEGRNIWQYNQRMIKGDCGTPLLINTKSGMKIAGLHVAGDAFTGNSEVLTMRVIEEAEKYFSLREVQGFCADVEYVEEEFFDAESDLDGNFYFLGRVKNPPYQKGITQIVKSPLFEVLQPHLTEPAVLSPTDKRMDEVMSPIISSVAKYGSPIIPFPHKLMAQAFGIVSDMYRPINQYKLRTFNHTEAINSRYTPNLEKLDLSTSAGYPWNTKGKNKTHLFDKDQQGEISIKPELQNVINRCENLLDKKTMFPYTLVTTLKDERVSLKKIKIGKTRTFMNFPVEYTVLMRKYFDDFIDKETLHAFEIGTTVGVNIYSSQWHKLFLELSEFDKVTDGDFKAFDGTIRPEFFKMYASLVNKFYGDEYQNHRHLLCTGCCFAPMFVLDKVYMKFQGNPSGSRLTTSFNSFVNRMYVVMSMLRVLPIQYHNNQFFRDNIKIFAHGDDHIIGFTNLVNESWDALELRSFMKSHGIDYTSSNKDEELKPSRPLNQCFYLKSHFVYNNSTGQYQAGLEKEVIQEMVSWQRDHDLRSTEMICQTALRYAYFWGKEYFDDIYSKLDNAIKAKHLKVELVDFISLEQYYLYNGQMDFSYV